MKNHFLLFLLISLSFNTHAQSQFNRAYGQHLQYDEFMSVCATPDGGYAFFGNTVNPTSGLFDFLLVKVNNSGVQQWSKSYSYATDIFGSKIVCNNAGDLFFVGSTYENAPPFDDIVLVKANSTGDIIWSNRYGGSDIDDATDMVLDTAGNIVISGNTYSFGTALKSGFAIKTDTSGAFIWSKTYSQNLSQEFNGILNTKDGGYLFTGFTQKPGGFNLEGYVVKANSNGLILWSKRLGGNGTEIFYHACQDAAQDIYIAGTASTGTINNSLDGWLVKMDNSGANTLLNYTYGNASIDRIYNVLFNGGTSLTCTGHSNNNGGFENNLYLDINKTTGTLSGSSLLSGVNNGNSRAYATIYGNSGLVQAGYIIHPGDTTGDAYAVKYSSMSPCQIVLANITSTNQSFNFNYADSSGSISSTANVITNPIVLIPNAITINPTTFCAVVSTNTIDKIFRSVQLTPNPANTMLKITIDRIDTEPIKVKILDITGHDLLHGVITENELQVSVADLKPGVYQVLLEEPLPTVRKFIKID